MKTDKKLIEYITTIGSAPAFAPPRTLQGLPPLPRVSGQTGEMTTAPSVTASQLMQKTMMPEDIEYWAGDEDEIGASFNPPYLLDRDAYGNMKTAAQHGAGGGTVENVLRKTVRLMLENVIDEDEDEEMDEETSEMSTVGGGAIAGYIGSLGAKKRDKKQDKVNTSSFGGGKYVK